MKKTDLWVICIITALAALSATDSIAGEVTIPNVFSANTPAKASEVNANFTAIKSAVDDNATQIAAKQNIISDSCPDDAAIQSVSEDGTVICSPQIRQTFITVFSLAERDKINVTGSEPDHVRDVGEFTKQYDDSRIVVYYQDSMYSNGFSSSCILQVRIDDTSSGEQFSPPVIVNRTTVELHMMSTGVFTGLSAGTHTVSLYSRAIGSSCVRNSDELPTSQITVIEMP